METFKLRIFVLVPFHLFFFTLFMTCNLPATNSTQLMSISLQDDSDVCKKVNCGKGTCNHQSFGYRCDCDSGWKKFSIGILEFPACIIPNCTFDSRCGNGSPLPPPPPLANLSDPCLVNLCGDGTCVRDGSGFRCQCNEGSANLLNDPKLTCFKKCSFGADCNGLDLGPDHSQTPPPPQNSGSPQTGSGEMQNWSTQVHLLTTMVFAAIFLK